LRTESNQCQLSHATPSVLIIGVQTRRELHGWPTGEIDGATKELAEISTPGKVIRISIEHWNLEKVNKFGILTTTLTFDESSQLCRLSQVMG
jgi:hypothetical protein